MFCGKFKMFVCVSALAIVGLCLAPIAHATIICTHSGQADPATEGFSKAFRGSPVVGPGNDGVDYWGIACPGGDYCRYSYSLTSEQLADPEGWQASAYVKLQYATSTATADQVISVRNYTDIYGMLLYGGPGVTNPGVYMYGSNWDLGDLIFALDPTLAYHTYTMWYDPSITGVHFFVDGVERATQTAAQAPGGWNTRDFYFGDNGTGASTVPPSSGHWAMARFETGPIPEPSTLVLLATGMVGLLCYAWRKRK